ncbi:glycosyltransferase [Nitratireductor sp.]|uniref:glycosyltransferase n=1 Tax=Nitratireductor sp. TaxID=1872084 RepID=UPI00345C45C0
MSHLTGVKKFVCVGRLSPEKGQARLLRAFSKLIASGENAVLMLVGSGPSERALKSLARRIGIQERVIFLGRLSNPYPVINFADCLVLPSDYEGQGLVLLEAMTLNTPCIGSDIPSIRGILGNGHAGLSKRTADDLAKKMLHFCREGIDLPSFDPCTYNYLAMRSFYSHTLGLNTERSPEFEVSAASTQA